MVVNYKVGDKVRFIKFDNWTEQQEIKPGITYTISNISKDREEGQLIGINCRGRIYATFFFKEFVYKVNIIKRDIPWL